MKSKLFKVLGVVAVVAMLATALVAPVAALSAVSASVAAADTTISLANADYTVNFNIATSLVPTDTITITFPAGTVIADGAIAGASISASPGWAGSPSVWTTAVVAGVTFAGSSANRTIIATLSGADVIGETASVRIFLPNGITNPGTAGDYTLTVKTSKETTAVTSNAYTLINPPPVALPGVASVYNDNGILMSQSNSVAAALGTVGAHTNWTIKLSAGTYAENLGVGVTAASTTIVGTGTTAADVIIKDTTAAWAIAADKVTFDSLTIDGTNFGLSIAAGGTNFTIKNCIFNKGAAQVTVAAAATPGSFSNDTFNVAAASVGITTSAVNTVANCTFNIAITGAGILEDTGNLTVSGSTFTGATGATTSIGVSLTGGAASVIGTSTFTSLASALRVAGGTTGADFKGNTVTGCGIVTTGPNTIEVTGTAGLQVYNNKITNSVRYIVNAAANGNLVTVMANTFKGNAKAAASVGGLMLLSHNYWSGEAVPAETATETYVAPLGGAPTNGSVAVGVLTLDASTTAGVKILASAGSTVVGAVALAANPVTLALPTTVTAKGYYDVFGVGTTASTIEFVGTTAKPITATDAVYWYNAAFNTWNLAPTTALNTFGNYIDITGGAITGTPFALVTVLPTIPPPAPDATPQYPEDGAVNIPIDVTFTWASVAGATGYQFAIAQDNPDLTNKFAVLDYSANTITNAHKVQEVLLYNTTYWWEVRSVAGTVYSPWTIVSFFTTEKAPAPPTTTATAPPITITNTTVTYTNPPVTTITYTLPQPKETQPIPSYLLWAVIAVGAVLVIAVIVLIVRTRRMP